MKNRSMLPVLLCAALGGAAWAEEPEERVFEGKTAVLIRAFTPSTLFKAEMPDGVIVDADAACVGALAMADALARLNTQPVGLTLPLAEPGALIQPVFDAGGNALQIRMRDSLLTSMELPELRKPFRILLSQRDQAALYVVDPATKAVVQVFYTRLDYQLALQDGPGYAQCKEVTAHMGDRELSREEVEKGFRLDALDEASDLVIRGTDPMGEPFVHRYAIDPAELAGRMEDAWQRVSRQFRGAGRQD